MARDAGGASRAVDGDLLRARLSSPRVVGGMTPKPGPLERLLLAAYAEENLGDPDSYPASWSAFRYVASRLSQAFLGAVYPAVPTSGGTEANIMALYAARESGAERVIAPPTAHYSVVKAARLLRMKLVQAPLENDGLTPDLAALERIAGPGDVIVATVGTTETGYVDPVSAMAEIAETRGARIHVDAAYAGPVARFTAPRGRLPGGLDATTSWAGIDAHKVVDAPFQAGVLLTAPGEDERLWFEAPYTPSGRQPGLLGSRAGAPFIAAAHAVAVVEDEGGFEELARRLMSLTRRLAEELVERGPFTLPHEPMTPVLCLMHPKHGAIVRALRAQGYNPYTCPRWRGLRLALTRASLEDDSLWEAVEALLKAAREA